MSKWTFTKGLHEVGNGVWAYLQPDGSWGWSNAGVIVDGDQSLLVDTLFDLKLTGEMLDDMRRSIPATRQIDVLVNTHADGDHTFGNQLVEGARIITSQGTADEFSIIQPAVWQNIADNAAQFGAAGEFISECFRPFDFSDVVLTPPTETFSGHKEIRVGDKIVELIEVGPAHSLGDTLIHVPADGVVYTGDILFNGGTPIAWYGPVHRWVRACDVLLDLDAEVIVAGHGPIATKDDVRRMKQYLTDITGEARRFYDAGVSWEEAVREINLGAYADWDDAERVAVTLQTLYDDFSVGDQRPVRDKMPYFAVMKAMREKLGKPPVHAHIYGSCDCGKDH
ncbi:MBL fold metallo-hydrolase [Pararhodobacter zhoushanensis]|uniref:MBL fold metallo-hydrolase n=1 Tax=Pararhodobacter zhoushanensis TaxID=2479545 RepID=UPI000F8C600A|nr:MBL fold metallo-hydrolase [Pararhodobacter zhoushanensis]